MKAVAEHELTYQLNASLVAPEQGLIRGATVAQSGVAATGKVLCLDKNGERTFDEDLIVQTLPVFTDDKTLVTLMAAAVAGGGIFKVRSDHDDSLDARAGFADSFTMLDGRVTADLHLFASYRDRAIVLETAATTPKLIGLSIDFSPSFEVIGEKAFMRVDELTAVDIVDEGAITHAGMFMRRGVDKVPTIKNPTTKLMADAPTDKKTEPSIADCMTAIAALAATVGKLSTPPVAPADKVEASAKPDELSATLAKINETLAAQGAELLKLKKEKAALGITVGGSKAKTAEQLAADAAAGDDTAAVGSDELERTRLAADKLKAGAPKSFLGAVDAKVKESAGKLKRSDASRLVMKESPALYEAHLLSKGVVRERATA